MVVGIVCASSQADVFNMGGTQNADGSWNGLASLEMVTVGNPGNAPYDHSFEYYDEELEEFVYIEKYYGAVDYVFQISKFEVTNAQYVEFLNANAAVDANGLYHTSMSSHPEGCGIQRSGYSGHYTYSVPADRANHPVNFVSYLDAVRFCNWLHNGQDSYSTEYGSYEFENQWECTRSASATWCIPSVNEWHKAAYHKNDGATGNYWDYPTGTNNTPSNDLVNPDPGNNANFYQYGHTLGGPYYTTTVGQFENSESPYGTFDQGGNLWEWNEIPDEMTSVSSFGFRGGSWDNYYNADCSFELDAWYDNYIEYGAEPSLQISLIGFRVALLGNFATPVDVTWTGAVGSAWSTGTTGNWKATVGGSAAEYADGINVVFDDSATGSLTANINAADVSPTSVTFNNATKDYAVTGTKGIVGEATVLKQGEAKVTISSINSYTGVTTVESGTLQLNGDGAQAPVLNIGGANIKAGKLVFDYTGDTTPAATIRTLLTVSYHSGNSTHFDVGQFRSLTADGDHALGWRDNIAAKQVMVAYTLYGDATLNGAVDISDLAALGQNWNGTNKVWVQGDFNYDGKVDISDLAYLGQHWNQSMPSFDGGEAGMARIPEPNTLAMLIAGLMGLAVNVWRKRK